LFVFWSITVDLISNDSASAKRITSVTTAEQGAWTDCQIVVLVLFCELFWNSSCANFVKSKSVLDDSMSRTMTVGR
jgi:hypothetical protein